MAIVRLNLTLKRYIQDEESVEVQLDNDTPLLTVLEMIGVPEEEVGMVIRNGRWESGDCTVGVEDELNLFPILSGG